MTNDMPELLPCREAFEKWYTNKPGCPSVAKCDGEYVLMQAHAAWLSWQAAWNTRADLSQPKQSESVRSEHAQPQNVEGDKSNPLFVGLDMICHGMFIGREHEIMRHAAECLKQAGYDNHNIRAALSQPKQEPVGDVRAALDWVNLQPVTAVNIAIKRALTAQQQPVNSELGTAAQAIEFAITIDDHYDRLEFLESWQHGDLSEWDDFKAFSEFNRCKAIARAEQKGGVTLPPRGTTYDIDEE